MEKQITLVLADDHPLVLAGFALALEGQGHKILAKVNTPEAAYQSYFEFKPDVIILDIRFGNAQSGIEVAKRILKEDPKAKIIFLSQFDQVMLVKESYRLGGGAFMMKSCTAEELSTAVQLVYKGGTYYSPDVAVMLADLMVHGNSPQDKLETRELQIFVLLAKGYTAQEISDEIDISVRLVSDISQSIKKKLDVHRPAEITLLAVKYNLIDPTKPAGK